MTPLRDIVAIGSTLVLLPLAGCATASAWDRPRAESAYNTGFSRGEREGITDARRGDRFDFTDERDYRDAERTRPRGEYEARARDEFLRGFANGYRRGYDGTRRDAVGPPPWSNGRGRGSGAGRGTAVDTAARLGYQDGYDAGRDDGRAGRRFDPLIQMRYRNGDRGYERQDGSRERYKDRYRQAFRDGYEQGYAEGRSRR